MIFLETKNTSYVINIKKYKKLENVYYGKKIKKQNIDCHIQENEMPNTIVYDKNSSIDALERLSLEIGEIGKGDFKEPTIEIVSKKGYTTNFKYISHKFLDEKPKIIGMPSSYESDKSLEITLYDEEISVEIILVYNIFYQSDVITRHIIINNKSNVSIELNRVLSFCLDIDYNEQQLINFSGAWAREMDMKTKDIIDGIYINDSKVGTSSNRHNPFFIVKDKLTNDFQGNCYGFNLVYSGNHASYIEVSPYGKLRISSGINPFHFNIILHPNQSFYSPEAVLTFSSKGLNSLSQNMHNFVLNHIVRKEFRKKERAILINNWEATYFDFNKEKLLNLAREAAELGIELFVLDDGWFGERNDDTSSLGDWFPNEKKLSGKLTELVEEINEIGLDFGIWLEPEMVNKNSQLYQRHPEWIIGDENGSTGRNQYILDLSNDIVVDYLYKAVSNVLKSANIKYVKWDMNRYFSDIYSTNLHNQGELLHKYVLGLYKLYDKLTSDFKDILFEGCSSGGNRFDLGILSYMPQIWLSDNTDAISRIIMQNNASYGYPQSCFSSHVSECPNHQTRRIVDLETRFNVSSFAILGYEIDLLKLSEAEKTIIKNQISFYKTHRKLLQFGNYYRINNLESNNALIIDENNKALLANYNFLRKANPNFCKIKTFYLNDDIKYQINSRKQSIVNNNQLIDHNEEVYHSFGDYLNYNGIDLYQSSDIIENKRTKFTYDFSSTIYKIEEKE